MPFAEDVSRYGIWTKEDLAEDVMWDVIASWNLSPQVEHIGLPALPLQGEGIF